MRTPTSIFQALPLLALTTLPLSVFACSSDEGGGGTPPAATGGMTSTGGSTTTGGAATGGMKATGGTVGSGGTTGGTKATGGAGGASGGTPTASGGMPAGGSGGGGTSGAGGKMTAGTGGDAAGAGGNAGGAGKGGDGGGGGTLTGGAGGGGSGTGEFKLTSPNHMDGAAFAPKYTCAEKGFNGSLLPELNWTPGPEGTKSYAITFIDTELAPENMLGYHWVIYNIPATVTQLPEEFKDAMSIGASQNREFLGPCPGGNLDTYEFAIYALDTETLMLTQTTGIPAVQEAEMKLEADHLAKAVLTGTSDVSQPN